MEFLIVVKFCLKKQPELNPALKKTSNSINLTTQIYLDSKK